MKARIQEGDLTPCRRERFIKKEEIDKVTLLAGCVQPRQWFAGLCIRQICITVAVG